MDLRLRRELIEGLHSLTQQARRLTEDWAARQQYCVRCQSAHLEPHPNNRRVADLQCPVCQLEYQLKAQQKPFGTRLNDGAYAPMRAAVESGTGPAFLFMHYSRESWQVRDLSLVPSFAFPLSAVVARPPLGPHARRAGWQGCYFDLTRIASSARLPILTSGQIVPTATVRGAYAQLERALTVAGRNHTWTFEVLRCVENLPAHFTTQDAYSFAPELARLFPANRNVEAKIRQQLQVLRDAGYLTHTARGHWNRTHQPPPTPDA